MGGGRGWSEPLPLPAGGPAAARRFPGRAGLGAFAGGAGGRGGARARPSRRKRSGPSIRPRRAPHEAQTARPAPAPDARRGYRGRRQFGPPLLRHALVDFGVSPRSDRLRPFVYAHPGTRGRAPGAERASRHALLVAGAYRPGASRRLWRPLGHRRRGAYQHAGRAAERARAALGGADPQRAHAAGPDGRRGIYRAGGARLQPGRSGALPQIRFRLRRAPPALLRRYRRRLHDAPRYGRGGPGDLPGTARRALAAFRRASGPAGSLHRRPWPEPKTAAP